jgi:antitoxin ParD1/3/4
MNITIKPEHEQFIQSQIAAGKYSNVQELIDIAIELLADREHKLEELRQRIAIGTEQISRGQVTDGEIVFARLQEKINRI